MANLEARIRMAAESILENEALRDGLYDEEAAGALLNWGVSRAESLARQTADIEDDEEADEAMYPRMKALRKMMGAVKDLTTAEGWSVDMLRQSLETVISQARVLNGESWQPSGNIASTILLALQSGDTRTRLNALLKLATGTPEAESPATQPGGIETAETVVPANDEPKQPNGFLWRLFRRKKGD